MGALLGLVPGRSRAAGTVLQARTHWGATVVATTTSANPESDDDLVNLPSPVDPLDWPELSYELGVTDGLPTFPPERSVVERLVAGSGLPPDLAIGPVPPSGRIATVEVVAANAAMAGCLPAHVPVVLAALEAMLEPRFNLAGVVTTTHPCWPLVIVSGRVVTDLHMATAESVFSGGGARANTAIGRAIRLITWNVGGGRPRHPVQEVFGHPGRLAYCIAETPATPWPPLHEARGVTAASAVTVFACEAPQSAAHWGLTTASNPQVGRQWLELYADQMRARGNSNTHTMGEILLVVTPSTARTLAAEGWTREAVQEFLWERARRRLGDIRLTSEGTPAVGTGDRYEWWPEWVDQTDPDQLVPVAWTPADIHVVVAGGDSIPWGAICPSWGHLGGFAITRPVGEAR
jgi:hypothetical protein